MAPWHWHRQPPTIHPSKTLSVDAALYAASFNDHLPARYCVAFAFRDAEGGAGTGGPRPAYARDMNRYPYLRITRWSEECAISMPTPMSEWWSTSLWWYVGALYCLVGCNLINQWLGHYMWSFQLNVKTFIAKSFYQTLPDDHVHGFIQNTKRVTGIAHDTQKRVGTTTLTANWTVIYRILPWSKHRWNSKMLWMTSASALLSMHPKRSWLASKELDSLSSKHGGFTQTFIAKIIRPYLPISCAFSLLYVGVARSCKGAMQRKQMHYMMISSSISWAYRL